MRNILRDPLLHFLLIGVCLFAVNSYLNEEEELSNSQTITVNRESLLTFMQYRSKLFDKNKFAAVLAAMSAEELQRLTDDYVHEEALYREAKVLQLDENDYASRRRLILQLENISRVLIESSIKLTEQDLQDYLDANAEEYYEPTKITFTHVFFSAEKRGASTAEELATRQLQELNDGQVPFHKAPSYGDRFLYHRNYVENDASEIASHFGEALQAQVFDLQPSDKIWYGPFRSNYGFHLLMVTRKDSGYAPRLEDVRQRVAQDALQSHLDVELSRVVQEIVTGYTVIVTEALQ